MKIEYGAFFYQQFQLLLNDQKASKEANRPKVFIKNF